LVKIGHYNNVRSHIYLRIKTYGIIIENLISRSAQGCPFNEIEVYLGGL